MSIRKKPLSIDWRDSIIANMSAMDRVVRVLVTIVLAEQFIATADPNYWQFILALFSLPLLVTVVLAWDPLYALFEISTAAQVRSSKSASTKPISGILVSAAYVERLRKARYPSQSAIRDSVA